jgi:hypothetical protein
MARNYSYDTKYEATKEQKRRRAERNKARRNALKDGRAKKNDGTDVHHVNKNLKGGTRVVPSSKNRSWK